MKTRNFAMGAVAAGLVSITLALSGCFLTEDDSAQQWKAHDDKLQALDAEMKSVAQRINAAGGMGHCVRDEDCRALGLGPETCGGYPTYLVYSISDADEPQVRELVSEFNAASRQYNDLSMRVPHCGRKQPAVRCESKKCVSLGE